MKSILVVDDDPDIAELVKNRLEVNNYQVTVASNGQEGIRIAQQNRPDLILMDIMMPKITGGEAVRLLKSDHKTKFIPIIFLTAVTSNMPQGEESKGINVDGEFYPSISKPFDPAKLLFTISRAISNSL